MNKLTKLTFAACLAAATLVVRRAPAADWPMWLQTPDRHNVATETGAPTDWDVESNKNIKWSAKLGSYSFGNPIVTGGLVIVGTNNEGRRDPKVQGDASCLMIFDEKTGKFLYQRVSAKLQSG